MGVFSWPRGWYFWRFLYKVGLILIKSELGKKLKSDTLILKSSDLKKGSIDLSNQKVKSEHTIKFLNYFWSRSPTFLIFRDHFSFLRRPLEYQDRGVSFYQDQKDQAFQDPFSLSVIDATFSFCWSHFLDQVVSILYHGNAF